MTTAELCFAFGPFRLLPDQRLLLRGEKPVRIGSRSFDILVSLVQNRSVLVDKERLKRLVWPGSVVADHNLTVHMSSLRKALNEDEVRYIATIPGRGYRFVASVEAVGPVPSGSDNLPVLLGRLIGRQADLAQVAEVMAESRLATIVGAGGIGKTHLAMEAVRPLVRDYTHGAWLVELASVTDPELVPAAIAAAMRMELYGTDGLDGVTRFLRDRQALILLDNCEHLLDAAAAACDAILKTCPGIRILATSREPLRSDGERLYWLPALAVPPASAELTGWDACGYPAIELLVERARLTGGDTALLDRNAPAMAEICRRLDGIPLALELAAPLLRVMSPAELAARLDDRFGLLTGGRRTALPRQQTLKAAIDWSYGMLSPDERIALRRLSIFAGPWTIAAAATVVADPPLSPGGILDQVAALVDKSLVSVDVAGEEPVYRLLETTRQYAAERQAEHDEPDRHAALARWLITRGQAAEADWQTTGDRLFLARYAPDVENLRLALNWCFGSTGDLALGQELVSVSYTRWSAHSLFAERRRWIEKAMGPLSEQTPAPVAARLWYGSSFADDLQDPTTIAPTLRAIELFRATGDDIGLARALVRAAIASSGPSDIGQARAYLAEAERLIPPEPSRIQAVWFRTVGEIQYLLGDSTGARAALVKGAAVARAICSPRTHLDIQVSLAELEFGLGAFSRAAAITEAALDDFDELPDRYDGMIRALANLAIYRLASGDLDGARGLALRSLDAARVQGLRASFGGMIERCALIALERGQAMLAARLLGYANARAAVARSERQPSEAYVLARFATALTRVLPPDRLRHALAEGAALSEEEALADAGRA